MKQEGVLTPTRKLPAFIFSWVCLCLLCVFVFQNIKALLVSTVPFKIGGCFFFFVFIDLSVHHIVTQSFPPVQPLLIVRGSQLKKKKSSRLPWWLSGNESASQSRRHGCHPWSGKMPHAKEQLSQCDTTIEPVLSSLGAENTEATCCSYWSPHALGPVLCNKSSRHHEKPAYHH